MRSSRAAWTRPGQIPALSSRLLIAAALILTAALVLAISSANRPTAGPIPDVVVRPAADARVGPVPERTATTDTGHRRVVVDRSSVATSEDGRATASNRVEVVVGDADGRGQGVVVHSSGTATANTGGNVVTGDGTITTGDATAIGNDTTVGVEPTPKGDGAEKGEKPEK